MPEAIEETVALAVDREPLEDDAEQIEQKDADHEGEKEQHMQQRHQNPGGGARQILATLLARPLRGGPGTQERVRQDNFVGQTC